jgi:cellulose synthase/poly-beta-1,6-N-acetylglucosamine synthase-like glycosyltransferase
MDSVHIVSIIVQVLDVIIVAYVVLHFGINLMLVGISGRRIRHELRAEQIRPASTFGEDRLLPTVTLLVPAYNEEVTIAESLRSLLRLKYPSFEIVICNDGSKDRTLQVLLRAFDFVPIDIDHSNRLGCSVIRGCYEVRSALAPGLKRMVLIDKENGGKADALNACINLAQGDYVTSMDADSLLIPEALLMAARVIAAEREPVVAVGAQVGLSNGSLVENGRVVEMRLPASWIARFQIVEYMRSFAQGRVAFATLDSLLVLSGVFALMRRDLVIAIGGFLTKHMRARVTVEYCGVGAHTVCEDMEIVVRLHRYLLDHKLPGKVTMLPFPIAWTEAPENYRDLGKQRARWYRGLLEVLLYHRGVMLRPRFRAIGMFALPYQLVFEAMAPVLECMGIVGLLCTMWLHMASLNALLAFLVFAMAANLCLSTLSILICIRSEQQAQRGQPDLALFSYASMGDTLALVFAGLVSNFGYRQYLMVWQVKGLWDFLRGKKTWDKFARKGFAVGTG